MFSLAFYSAYLKLLSLDIVGAISNLTLQNIQLRFSVANAIKRSK